MSMEEIKKKGILEVVEKGVAIAKDGTESFYVSYDIDAIDPAYAPGTGGPEPGGITAIDILDAAYKIGIAKPSSFDITELFMCYDPSGSTASLAAYIILYTLAGISKKDKQ